MTTPDKSPEPVLFRFTGKKFYSAGVIAAYTVLANMSVGCVLYGFNLQARGLKLPGRLIIACGVASGLALFSSAIIGLPFSWRMKYLSLFAAFCFYMFERGPVKAALKAGATLARWWLPALILAAVVAALLCVVCLIP